VARRDGAAVKCAKSLVDAPETDDARSMKGIIVGVDESSYALAALRWAVDYGACRDLPVTAVLAWDYILQHHVDADAPFDPTYGSAKAAGVLEALVTRAVGDGQSVERLVVCNRAGPALIEAADIDASLVVVGARGMSGFKGLLLGSVSRYVLHAATGPVAVIRADAGRGGNPVVVGLDGSQPSRRALTWAVDYAICRKLRLVALHAWMPPYSPLGLYAPFDLGRQHQAAKHFLDEELATVEEANLVEPIDRRVTEDRASSALLEASSLASVVVVGSRGRGQLSNTLLGSVSDQVSHYATCPVVVVP
jgi:nucleotide-binding universal stress UspA family protein